MLPGGKFWTVPNALSLSRLVLLPLFVYALSRPELLWLAGVLVAYGIVSDALDGYIARRWQQSSEWGKLLDPLADKLTVSVALVYCYLARGFPLWVLLLILSRDLAILALAPVITRRAGELPKSNLPGRLTALSLAILAFVYILDFHDLKFPVTALVVAMILFSSISYLKRLSAYAH
jgi:CDP-diacylglycerol--glycerol-3-phosphate 3-phosphatidyltransferase